MGFAILLGAFWGLPGILGGVLISLVVIVLIWKPILLFRRGFGLSIFYYVKIYAKHIVILVLSWLVADFLVGLVSVDPSVSWINFIGYGAIVAVVFGVIMGGLLFVVECGMRDFVLRARGIVQRRF